MSMRSWTVTVRGSQWLNENHRRHWAARNRLVQEWRELAAWAVKAAGVPRLERAYIKAVCLFPDHRRRDAGNWYPTAKALVDGITDSRKNGALIRGILPDDDTKHLDGPHMYWRLECGIGVPTVELHIEEVRA